MNIEHVAPIVTDDKDQLVPVWIVNSRIHQINHAIDQIMFHLETIQQQTATQETT
jgi:hypothetical protein